MKQYIQDAVAHALKHIGAGDLEPSITTPENNEHGDYATNAALIAAKHLEIPPADCAEKLQTLLQKTLSEIARIEVAGPGFLNVHLLRHCFTQSVATRSSPDWRYQSTALQGREILVEYGSPNLFKPLHVGNLIGLITGEALCRIFELHGAVVRRINYPSDVGLSVAKAVWGMQQETTTPTDIAALGKAYRTGVVAYDTNPDAKQMIEEINRCIYTGSDSEIIRLRDIGRLLSLQHIESLYTLLGVTMDDVIFESEVSEPGKNIVQNHTPGIFEEDAGATVFRGNRYGLHTRVFLNSAGLPTYEAKDLGNFAAKQERYQNWDTSIVITGAEQREYFAVIIAAIREVFAVPSQKQLEHVATGVLTLPGTGKMSARAGNVLTADDILSLLQKEAMTRAATMRTASVDTLSEQIAVAALKYRILRQHTGSNIVFAIKQAFSFEGDSGPTCSIHTPGLVLLSVPLKLQGLHRL